jgi:serine/threonine protein kinase/formylglycine-generating enzyme required for sulfatase activity
MFEFDFFSEEEKNNEEENEAPLFGGIPQGDEDVLAESESEPEPIEDPDECNSVFKKGQELGHYKIIRCLSRAGIGETYLVSHVLTHKRYVLKILPKILIKDAEFETRFFSWKDNLTDLRHPNIIQTVDLQKDKGFFFIVMEYVESEEGLPVTLEDKLLRKQHFTRSEIKKLIIQLCNLLEYASRKQSLLHSDLKPENILFDISGNMKLSNFCLIDLIGIDFFKELFRLAVSQNLNQEIQKENVAVPDEDIVDKTASFMLLGKDQNVRFLDIDNITQSGKVYLQNLITDTSSFSADDFEEIEKEVERSSDNVLPKKNSILDSFDYMSPEQKVGNPITVESGIYSLGLILYRLLTGQKVTGNWGLPSTYGRSWDWDDIVVKCLKGKPHERFHSLVELREAVEKVGKRRSKTMIGIVSVAVIAVISTTVAGMYYFKSGKLPFQLTEATNIVDINNGQNASQKAGQGAKVMPVSVFIKTHPGESGYTVFDDGKIIASGQTLPTEEKMLKLKPGQYTIKIEKKGYKTYVQYLCVTDADEHVELALTKVIKRSEPNGVRQLPVANSPWSIPGLEMVFVPIPAGTLTLYDTKKKPHSISFNQPMWAGKYEVSQIEFEEVVWKKVSFFKMSGLDAPVDSVTWGDATQFCQRLTSKEKALGRLPEGYVYRLPTNEEWEYCSRAGSKAIYSFGNDESKLTDFAWYIKNSKRRTQPKGKKMCNEWGIYDMMGNVWEWCQKLDHSDVAYIDAKIENPENYFILRGGSWDNSAKRLQSKQNSLLVNSTGFTNNRVGFRVMLAPELKAGK